MGKKVSNLNDSTAHEPIAIIGIGCRFPGEVDSPEDLWQLLIHEQSAVGEIPKDRFDANAIYDPRPAIPGRIYSRKGGFLSGIDQFEAGFFEISPREAERLDPQQRLLLETAWEAMEDAGQVSGSESCRQTGVFIGVWLNDFESQLNARTQLMDFYSTTGGGRYSASGRLSHFFGFSGPSLTVDTACSSSLVAVHLAIESLRSGEVSLAIAGGVNIILQPQITIAYSQARMMALDGCCKFGDARADGYVRSEGAAVLVLKPLSRAQEDGDRIYAVIRGSAVNNDGRSGLSLGTPAQAGQEDLLRKAYADAGVSPGLVRYIEAHGTGTRAGDPVELAALGAVLSQGRPADVICAVGSIKTNLGHTEGAAGAAGLIKVALALHNRILPASLHFQIPNPDIPWETIPLRVQKQTGAWPAGDGDLVAGVSAFGIAGTNAHVVLQSAPPPLPLPAVARPPMRPFLLPLSARSKQALAAQAEQWVDFLSAASPEALPDILYTQTVRRSQHPYRLAAYGGNAVELSGSIKSSLDKPFAAVEKPGKVVFVFPGQGSQWEGMGRKLYESEPAFHQAFDECERALQPYLGLLPGETLLHLSNPARLNAIEVVQPLLFAIQVALARFWISLGIQPEMLIGHSMGEAAAAHIAGVLSLDDAARLICLRSQLMSRLTGRGAMLLVGLGYQDAEEKAAHFSSQLSPAVSNSPSTTVLSGEPGAIAALASQLEAEGIFCRTVKVDVAAHSPQMEALVPELVHGLAGITVRPASINLYSTVIGKRLAGEEMNAEYWGRNLRQTVRFADAVSQALQAGGSIFLEISPHPVLVTSIEENIAEAPPAATARGAVSSFRRNEDEIKVIMQSLGDLYCLGAQIQWEKVYPRGNCVSLPGYPWQRSRYWLPDGQPKPLAMEMPGRLVEIPSLPGTVIFDLPLDPAVSSWMNDYQVSGRKLFPASAWLEIARRAVGAAAQAKVVHLQAVHFSRPFVLTDASSPIQIHTVLSRQGRQFHFSVFGFENDSWTIFAEGTAAPLDALSTEDMASDIKFPAEAGEDALQLYEQLERRGVSISGTLRPLSRVWKDGNRTIARLEPSLPVPLIAEPALDLALSAAGEAGAAVFTGLESMLAWTDPAACCWLELEGNRVVGYDAAGKPIFKLEGLKIKALADPYFESPLSWLYSMEWELAPTPDKPKEASEQGESGNWLIFADSKGHGEALARRLKGLGPPGVLVFEGQNYRKSGKSRFSLRPDSPEDFHRLFQELAVSTPGVRFNRVVYCWGLDATLSPEPAKQPQVSALAAAANLVRALQEANDEGAPLLWLITRGAGAVTGAGEPDHITVDPLQVALWGFGRTIANEHPDLWGGLLDLDPMFTPEQTAAVLAQEVAGSQESQVALRLDGRYIPRLKPYVPEKKAVPAYRWDPGAAYLITGGFGGIGSTVARWMVERGASHLILMSRTALPQREEWGQAPSGSDLERRIGQVRALEALGAHVLCAAVDVSDYDQTAAWLEAYRNAAGRPIRGLVHCAAVLDDRLVSQLELANFQASFGAKSMGAQVLASLLPDLDFLVLFSSIDALIGPVGAGSYSAANAFLDGLADRLRAMGKPAVSVDWGVWNGLGLTTNEQVARTVQQFQDQGIYPFEPEQGLEALERVINLLAGQAPLSSCLAVMPVDWRRYSSSPSPRIGEGLFVLQTDMLANEPEAPPADDGGLRSALQGMNPLDARNQLESYLQKETARILRLPAEQVERNRSLGAYGLDSLTGIELRNYLQTELGLKLPASFVWNYSTIMDMAARLEHLLAKEAAPPADHPDEAAAESKPAPQQPDEMRQTNAHVQDLLDSIQANSDDEVLKRLLSNR